MRYLQPYRLYEAAITEHPLLDGMRDTVGGRDLAALSTGFRVDRTGKLVIEGLRGKTFVQQQPNGTWRHWVLATGRVYGEGVYATLQECLAGCWTDFLLNSNSIRPQKMNMEAYRNLINSHLGELQGKALDQGALRNAVVRIMQQGFTVPIHDARDFLETSKWMPVLKVLGFFQEEAARLSYMSFYLFHQDSPIVNIFFTQEELSSAYSYRTIENHVGYRFDIQVEPWECLNAQIDVNSTFLEIGGERASLAPFADEIFGGKKLHRALTSAFAKDISGYGIPPALQQKMVALRQFGVQLLQKVAAGGNVADMVLTLLPVVQDKDFTFSQAKMIKEVMPELWAEYVKTHPDPDSVKHSALLADFF